MNHRSDVLILVLIVFFLTSCASSMVKNNNTNSDIQRKHSICNEYYYSGLLTPDEKYIDGCLAAARAGIPGAQYLVAFDKLVRGNEWPVSDDEVLRLLKDSSEQGNPLSRFLYGFKSYREGAKSLGYELIVESACDGYPEAIKVLELIGGVYEEECSNYTHNIDGVWIGEVLVNYDSSASGDLVGKTRKIKLVVENEDVKFYYYRADGDWHSLKNYNFQLKVGGRVFKLFGFRSGWDFDGQWNESIDIEVAKIKENEIFVSYRRFVSNEFSLPDSKGRVFSQFGEGYLSLVAVD